MMHFLRQFSGCCGPCQPIRYSATARRGSSRYTWTTWRRRSHRFCGRAKNRILSTNWPDRGSTPTRSCCEPLRVSRDYGQYRPFAFWNALARVAEMLPQPPLTRNQVELMQIDTTASERLPGFRALGISPRSPEDELEAILRQNKQGVLPR